MVHFLELVAERMASAVKTFQAAEKSGTPILLARSWTSRRAAELDDVRDVSRRSFGEQTLPLRTRPATEMPESGPNERATATFLAHDAATIKAAAYDVTI